MNSKSYKFSVLTAPTEGAAAQADEARASVGSPASVTHMLPAGRIGTLRVLAVPGARYLVTEDESGRAPQQIHARRRGKDLLIHIEDYRPDQIDLIVENFYQVSPGSFAGLAEDNLTYPFIPSTAELSDDIVALADGVAISQVLGSGPVGLLGAFGGAGAAGAAGAAGGAGASAFVGGAAAGGAAAGGAAAGGAGAGGGLGLGTIGAGGLAAAAVGGGGGGNGPAQADVAAALTIQLTDPTNSGPKNDTVTNVRRPSLVGTTLPGSAVMVTEPDGKSSPAQVDPQGNWTWTPAGQLAEGDQTFKVTASNGTTSTERKVVIGIQTSNWGAKLEDNLTALEAGTGNVKPGDNVINIAEFANGLRATITLAREPNRALTADDLLITGDAQLRANSLTELTPSTYTLVLEAKSASNSGRFGLKLKDSLINTASFTDLAGNTFTGASPALSYNYDTVRPVMTLTRTWVDANSDAILNINESAAGIRYTASFSEAPTTPLTPNDFTVNNGTVRANTFVINNQINSYSFVIDPTPNSTGQLRVELKATSAALIKDMAGNPLDPEALSAPALQFSDLNFDLRGPTSTFKLSEASDSGPKDETVTNVRRPILTGTTQPGNTVSIKGASGPSTPVPVDPQGNWSWTPAADLPDGDQPFQITTSNSAGAVTRDVVVGVYNSTWAATLADNLTALEAGSGNVKPGDNKLNIAEFANGLTATFSLARTASRDLSLDDLLVSGDAQVKAGSLLKTSSTSYTVVLEAKAGNNAGNFSLNLKDALSNTSSFTDLAGNLFTGSGPALSRSFDTVRPALTLARSWGDANNDDLLGISESAAGVSYSASFSEALGTAPTQSDFTVSNGTVRANSFAVNSQTNSYSFIVDPTPSSAGQLQVQLNAGAAALLKDTAGNPLDPASLASSALLFKPVSYNLQQPSLTATLADASNTGPKSDTVTSVRRPTLTGSTDPGNAVSIKPAASSTGSPAQVDAKGNWTWTPSADLPDGTQSFTATATNLGGNSATRNLDLTIFASTWGATLGDNLAALEAGSGDVKAGDNKLNIAEFADGLTATFSLARAASRDLSIDDLLVSGDAQVKAGSLLKTSSTSYIVVLEAKAANNAGSFGLKLKDALSNASSFTDLAGNFFTGSSPAPSRSFDTVRPALTLARTWGDTNNDSVFSTSESTAGLTYSASFSEALGTAPTQSDFIVTNGTIRANSFTVNSQTNSYSFTVDPTPSSTGQLQVQVNAGAAALLKDTAGNPLDPAALTSTALQFAPVSFDLQAPNLNANLLDSSNTGPKTDAVTSAKRPTLSGSTEPGNTVSIRPVGGSTSSPAQVDAQGNWTWTPGTDLPEGTQSFAVTATDPPGNSSSRNIDLSIIYPSTWGASLTDNLAALEAGTGNVRPGDNKLNITEFANGLTASITLARDPSRALTLNDLSVSGDAQFKSGSFRQVTLKTYSVVLEPKASNNNGSFNFSLLTPADLTDLAGNAFTGASPALSRSFDTISPKLSSLTRNWTDTKADNVVNIAESVGGIAYTASFSEALSSPLVQTDFSLTNGSIRANSFAFNSQTNSYSFIVDPTPNTAGQLQVRLRTDTVFKDPAGNALDSPPTSSINYDLIPPGLTVGSTPASTLAIQGSGDTLVPYTVSGQSSQNGFSASILGRSLSADATHIRLPAANVENLAEGYYSVTASAVDDAGNPNNAYQVLKVSRNTLPDDLWISGATPPTGSSSNDVFINRAGSQSFTGGSGADRFFWLKRDAGEAGKPDVDTITDFTKGGGNPDALNIADLLGTATGNNLSNLGLFVRSEQVDQNNNPGTGSTRLLISSSGKFDASNISNSLSVADQVILLQGVVTTVGELSNSNQLVWQAFWA